ncbi:hypothetical protein ACHWQZ_G001049 [Mnemiopsis leidyi]
MAAIVNYIYGVSDHNTIKPFILLPTVNNNYSFLNNMVTRRDLPSATCRRCVRTVRSGWSNEPDDHQVVIIVDPCDIHSSSVVRPTPPALVQTQNPTVTPAAVTPPPPPPPVLIPSDSTSPESTALQPDPTADSGAVPPPTNPPPSNPPPSNPLPSRPSTSRRRTFSLPYTVAEYDEIVQLVNAGSSLSAARETKGISRSHFTRKRCISEASKVDADGLRRSILQLRKVTLPNLYMVAKEICNRNPDRLRSLHAEGAVLPPKDRY